jgi:hypothetical protein
MPTLNGYLGLKILGMNLDSFEAKLKPWVGCCFGHYTNRKTPICN